MREPNDTTLEALLASTLAERAARVPATVTLERVHARLEERQAARRRSSVRRPLALLGIAAAILLPLAVLIVAQRPSWPDPADAVTYQAIVRRSAGDAWHVVAIRGDGQERLIASVPRPEENGRRRSRMVLSPDGWLAMSGSTGWEFRDVRSPDQVIGPIAPFLPPMETGGIATSEEGRAWIDDSRFAVWNRAGDILRFDPGTGTVESSTLPGPPTEVIAWTADGASMISHGDWGRSILFRDQRYPADWRLHSLDGESVDVTLADLDLGWRSGTWWRADGSRVQLCDGSGGSGCPGLPNGAVIVESQDGILTTWYTDELAPADVVEAALGPAGVWLLLDRKNDGWQTVLAHLEAPGDLREVATWGTDTRGPVGGTITAIAPDGSLIAVSASGELLVDARSGRVTPLEGELLGLLPSSTVDGWPGASFRTPDPVASPPPPLPVPTMLPLDTIVAEQLTPADRELWRGEYLVAEGPGSSPSAMDIGPLEFDEGIGVFLACDGPSDVVVTAETADGPGTVAIGLSPIVSRCLDPRELAGGYMPSAAVSGPVQFRVTTKADTSWRLLIFDPGPGE
jgi:hypothetical protein